MRATHGCAWRMTPGARASPACVLSGAATVCYTLPIANVVQLGPCGEAMQLTLIASAAQVALRRAPLAPGYALRPTRAADREALAELYLHAYAPHFVSTFAEAREEMGQTFAGAYGPLLPELSPAVICDAALVGAVQTVAQAPWPDTPPGPFIIEVMVRAEHRRRGLATAALGWAARRALRRGHATLALRVESANEGAVALYRGLGFRDWTGRG